MAKKIKNITEKEKQKYKYKNLKGETGIFIIEKITSGITESCKLPEAIELERN